MLKNNNATDTILKSADNYMKKNMPKEAALSYLKSLFIEKNNIKSYLGLSKAYREMKEYKKAIKHLEAAKKIAAFDYEMYFELGLCHLLSKNFENATKNFRKTIKLNPNNLNAQIQLAISHELMDEPDMAYKIYEKVIEEKPDFILAYNHKAGLLMSEGFFEEAQKVFFDILKIDNNYYRAYLGLGICFDKLKNYTSAVRFYKKYIMQNPKSETAKSLAVRISDIYSVAHTRHNCHLKIAK